MGSNWDGTKTLRRWSAGLCCAAGLFAGEHLYSADPPDGLLQQYQAAMQGVTANPFVDSASDAVDIEIPAPSAGDAAVTSRPGTESTEPRTAAEPAPLVSVPARPIPFIQARPITSAPTQAQSALKTGSLAKPSENESLPPIVTPSQAKRTSTEQTKTAPLAAVAPVVSKSAAIHPQPVRREAGAGPQPAPVASNRDSAIIHNPLVAPRKPLVPINRPETAAGNSLAPVASPAKPPVNILPASDSPAANRAPAAPVYRPKQIRPTQIRPVQYEAPVDDAQPDAHPVALHGYAPPKSAPVRPARAERAIPAVATPALEVAAEQPAAFQPLPAGEDEEFGKLPEGSPFETIGESGTLRLRVRRSMLLRTKTDVYRTATVDEAVVELVQFTPREISLIGRSQGQTHITFWFNDPAQPPVTYLVEVAPDPQAIAVQEEKYKLLENVINEMFPDSKVYLVLVADKLLVKGQARDCEEAAQIMTIIRAQAGNVRAGMGGGIGGGLTEGLATPVLSLAATGNNSGPGYTIINMLRVPGVQQVALKVKIAELNRSAARGFGVDVVGAVDIGNNGDELIFASILNAIGGGGTSVIASLDGGDLDIGIRYLQQRGVIRLLSEPTLVTLSGRPATFIAGGEFAVPTIVGNVGLNAVTTDFRAFGAIISFVPTVVDKDRIRLQVAPEFSQINNQLSVGGTPGLNVRAATTTVEMREGQTLAIAGLLEDTYNSTSVGDLPFLSQIFGRRSANRNETELIILVTPELVQPMEPEEVPPLPGFDVTEPTGGEFFLGGHIEGNPTRDNRSTVWPRLKRRYGMGGPAMTSGPFGHGQ